MSDQLIQRAELLIQQNRFKEAEQVLKDLLAQSPTDIRVIVLMAEVKLQQDLADEAETLVNSAIGLSPDIGYLYYLKARIFIQRKKYDLAEKELTLAITMDPEESGFYSLLASIKLLKKDYHSALEISNTALEHDAENISALNTRSTALLKLDRHEESNQTIEGALKEDPNNPYTHCNYGWNLLEKGDHNKALTHFSEALKNDPTLEDAQIGMAEALKSRYLLYKWFLKYSFWISNLTAKYQWGVIIGFYIGFKLVRVVASNNPTLEPYLIPLIILLSLFAFSTWIIGPVGNLFLRLNKFGKHLLTPQQIVSSNFVGISALIFLVGTALFFITQYPAWLPVGIFGITMMIPLSTMFSPTKYKFVLPTYTFILGILGIISIYRAFTNPALMTQTSNIYLLGILAFQWVANFLIIKEHNH